MAQVATVWTMNSGIDGSGSDMIEITAAVTADDATGAVAVEGLKSPAGAVLSLAGYYLYNILYYYGTTAVTNLSDLELLQHTSSGKDVLLGSGIDKLLAAANSAIQAYISGTTPGKMPIYGPLYMKVTNNVVNSAVFTLVFKFAKY